MLIRFDPSGSAESFARLVAEMDADRDTGLLLVLAGDANGFTPASIDPILADIRVPVLGGIFPKVINDGVLHDRGTVVASLPCRAATVVIEQLSDPTTDIASQLTEGLAGNAIEGGTDLIVVDGLSAGVDAAVNAIHDTFGLLDDYLGGGSGAADLLPSASVITNQGLLADAAVIAVTDLRVGIGVAHGWSPVAGPFEVTAAHGPVVVELDGRPALDVYREVVESVSGRRLDDASFAELAMAHPFGILRSPGELIVRDPVRHHGTELVCVGAVPSGAAVQILHGEPDRLIAAAGRAGQLAAADLVSKGGSDPTMIVIDCISRALFLGHRFPGELQALDRGLPSIGALTIGEIADSGTNRLEFLNKSSVIGMVDA